LIALKLIAIKCRSNASRHLTPISLAQICLRVPGPFCLLSAQLPAGVSQRKGVLQLMQHPADVNAVRIKAEELKAAAFAPSPSPTTQFDDTPLSGDSPPPLLDTNIENDDPFMPAQPDTPPFDVSDQSDTEWDFGESASHGASGSALIW